MITRTPSQITKLPSVSVVIPALDAHTTIAQTLDSIIAQDYPNVVEIIVADGSSAQDTRFLLHRCYPDVKVVINRRRIIPTALNLAISQARGEIIVRCDSHSVLQPDYVSTVVHNLTRPCVTSTGGMAIPTGDTWFGKAVALAVQSKIGSGDSRYKVGGESGPADTVYLGAFYRSAWEEIGGYDESLVAVEDAEFHRRLRNRGDVIWLDTGLKTEYRTRGTPWALAKQMFLYGRWRAEVVRRQPRDVKWRQLAPPVILLLLLASIPLGVCQGWWWGSVLPGLYVLGLCFASEIGRTRHAGMEKLLLPLALATMHVCWGSGFLVGMVRRPKA